MITRSLTLFTICLLCFHVNAAETAPNIELINRGKNATALLEADRPGARASATAFCIDASGIFVTSQHVVRNLPPGSKLNLVLHASLADQVSVPATVIRSDDSADLALLRVDGVKDLTPLQVGSIDNLVETMPLVAFGYPFGRMLAGEKDNTYPSITVSTGRITSLRKSRGVLQRIQLDASLNPGNSGGPLLDEQGKVVGVVASGIIGSGVNFAVPSSLLQRFIQKPDVATTFPKLTPQNLTSPHDFTCKITPLLKPKDQLKAVLAIRDSENAQREFQGTAEPGNVFRFKAVQVLPHAVSKKLRITARFSGGSIVGVASDVKFKAGARELHLSELSSLEAAPKARLTLADGTILTDAPLGLDAVEFNLGDLAFNVNLQRAANVAVEDLSANPPSFQYTLRVYDGQSLVDEKSGALDIEAAAPVAGQSNRGGVATGAARSATPLASDKETLRLPAPVDNLVAGGNGRYLILHMKKVSKLAIFDVTTAKIARYISMPDEAALIAAGSTKLVVVLPSQSIIQRWNLLSGERELSLPLPDQLRGANIAMGWASEGPLMSSNGILVDLQRLQPIQTETDRNGYSQMDASSQIRASADGSTFGLWRVNSSPSGLAVATVLGNKISWRYEHNSYGAVVPNIDGSLIMTASGIIKPDTIRLISDGSQRRGDRNTVAIPSYEASYYLAWRPSTDTSSPRSKTGGALSICTTDDQKTLITLNDLAELSGIQPRQQFDHASLTTEKRIHFFPSAKLLVTLGEGNDQLVLRRLDIIQALDKAGLDYLFVTSLPDRTAKRGADYVYPIRAVSKRGGLTYKLESGPTGMQIDSNGILRWRAASADGAPIGVIVSIKDASGQEVYHSFNIQVQ